MSTEAPASPIKDSDCLITATQTRKLCGGISEMSLHRWRNNPDLGFPSPTRINSRLYWRRDSVDAWLAERFAESEAAEAEGPEVGPAQAETPA